MKEEHPLVKLVLLGGYGQRQLDDAIDRGFLSHVAVEIGGADLYPVWFYSIDELAGQLLDDPRYPYKFVADIGMIVLPEITLERMENAVQRLYEAGYFRHLRPLSQEQLLKAKTSLTGRHSCPSDSISGAEVPRCSRAG